jgi:glycosyltransferase involved in cell wall biosynthesis
MKAPPPFLSKKVSVIIPCFNVERYIYECLDSVLTQGDIVHHIYCIDNNSTDQTCDQIENWKREHSQTPITLLYQKKPGASAARNTALPFIETSWIQFLDADDILYSGKISGQLSTNPTCDVILDSATFLAIDGTKNIRIPYASIETGLMSTNCGNTCSNLWKTQAILDVNGWDEELKSSQEYDLLFRLYLKGYQFSTLHSNRTEIRARQAGQISQSNPLRNLETYIGLRCKMMAAFNQMDLPQNTKAELHQFFFDSLRRLYPLKPELARSYFKSHLSDASFSPRVGPANTALYCLSFRIFGFTRSERIKRALSSVRKLMPGR